MFTTIIYPLDWQLLTCKIWILTWQSNGVSVNATNTKQMFIYHQFLHSINKVDSSLRLKSALSYLSLPPSLLQMFMFHLLRLLQLNARFANHLPVVRRLHCKLLILLCRWIVTAHVHLCLPALVRRMTLKWTWLIARLRLTATTKLIDDAGRWPATSITRHKPSRHFRSDDGRPRRF